MYRGKKTAYISFGTLWPLVSMGYLECMLEGVEMGELLE